VLKGVLALLDEFLRSFGVRRERRVVAAHRRLNSRTQCSGAGDHGTESEHGTKNYKERKNGDERYDDPNGGARRFCHVMCLMPR